MSKDLKNTSDVDGIPFENFIDLVQRKEKRNQVNWRNLLLILIIRFIQGVNIMGKTHHPDEHHQGVEIAYKMAYRD